MASSTASKKLNCKIILLDGDVQVFQLSRKALASDLYSQLNGALKLIETDYFGLEYTSTKTNTSEWLDKEKTILSQVSLPSQVRELTFNFKVKFYTSDPSLLEHDLTRYYYSLQIKQDLMSGRLVCSETTAASLASYIVQSELGDFYYQANDHDYLKSIKLLPNQTDEMEDMIADYHKTLRGMSVVDAEYQMLDVARKTELYGVVPYQCQNSQGHTIQLTVTHAGVHTVINNSKATTYVWVKIRKLGFKRKKFIIKLFPGNSKSKMDSVAEFTFHSRDAAKSFWKLSIEHHSFFKKLEIKPMRRNRHQLLSSGSSFRYNGRTQTQLVEQMKRKWGQSTFDRSMSLRSFSTTATHRIGKAATFQSRQELGIMTLDRARSTTTKLSNNLAVPSVSQATLESRYSGCYETTQQPPLTEKTPLAISHSLSAISSSLTMPPGTFDYKTSTTFLPKADGERDSNRDSIAVVEDNRVELERLVEQINSDLSSAQQAKAHDEEHTTRVRNISTSSIERFLTSTAQPLIPPVQRHGPSLQVPQQTEAKPLQQPELHQLHAISDYPNSMLDFSQKPTVTCTMSDEESLEMLLTECVKDTPVTDLDAELPTHEVAETNPLNNGINKSENHKFSVTADVNIQDMTVNDILDNAGLHVDDTLLLALDDSTTSPPNCQTSADDSKKLTDLESQAKSDLLPSDVIVLSSPDSGDEDLVFRSGLEFSIPPHIRRGRVRSRQEEMEDLQGLSQLAEKVLRCSEETNVRKQSQELSDLAAQVLDFCSDSNDPQPAQLSDLSDLLAHYDTIKQQQQAFNCQRNQFTNGHSLSISNRISVDVNGQIDTFTQPPTEKATRKPLIRPALPVLHVFGERLLDYKADSYKTGFPDEKVWTRPSNGQRVMADSGIDMDASTRAVSSSNIRQSSSDGYSSESEDSVHTITSPSNIVPKLFN